MEGYCEPTGSTKENEFLEYVGFEVLTAVVMKNSIFWDITPCSEPLKVDFQRIIRRFIPEDR
jgi:hypothetical protein